MAFSRRDDMPQYNPSTTAQRSIVEGSNYRFTVLTPALIRMEYSPDGSFEDRASTFAVHRDFAPVEFKLQETDDRLDIHTSQLWLQYTKAKFAPGTLTATMLKMPREPFPGGCARHSLTILFL